MRVQGPLPKKEIGQNIGTKLPKIGKKSEMVYAVVITLETGFRVYFQIRKYGQI